MSHLLGRLAAAIGSFRRVRVAGTAASLLTFALTTSGCSVILKPTEGSRLLQALARLIKLLPEGAPVAFAEFFRTWIGEDFAEKFNSVSAAITQRPDLSTSLWGQLLNGFAGIMFCIIPISAFFYLRKMSKAVDEHGPSAVKEGRGGVVPPFQMLGRILVVAFLIVAIPIFLQAVINFTWEIIHDFSTAAYADLGYSPGQVMFELLLKMVTTGGLGLIAVFVIFLFNGLALLFWASVFLWNFLMLFIRPFIAVWHTKDYLKAEAKDLEPVLERGIEALESIAYLALRGLVVLLGPFLVWWIVNDLIGGDSPLVSVFIAISMLVTILLATALPWIIFGFRFWFIKIPGLTKPFPELLKPRAEETEEIHGKAVAAVAGMAAGVAAAEAAEQGWLRQQLSKGAKFVERVVSENPRYQRERSQIKSEMVDIRQRRGFSPIEGANATPLGNGQPTSSGEGSGRGPVDGPVTGGGFPPPTPPPSQPPGPIPGRPRPPSQPTPSAGVVAPTRGVVPPQAPSDRVKTGQPSTTAASDVKLQPPARPMPSRSSPPQPPTSSVLEASKAGLMPPEKLPATSDFDRLREVLVSSELPVAKLSNQELAVCAGLRMEHYVTGPDDELIAAAKKFLQKQSGTQKKQWEEIGIELRRLLP